MTEEEKKAAELKAQEEAALAADPVAQKDAEIAKLIEERDNYKKVALKRLGKLEGDEAFMAGDKDEKGLTVAEQVREELLKKEISIKEQEREAEVKRILRENNELRLALKNRPDNGVGGGSNSGAEVKDNVFSQSQTDALIARAKKLGIDPEKYVARAKLNLSKNR